MSALVEAEREFLDGSIELREAERQRDARVAQQARARSSGGWWRSSSRPRWWSRLPPASRCGSGGGLRAAGASAGTQEAALANAQQTDHPDTALLLSADAYRRDVSDGTRYQLANALTHEGVPYQYVPLGLSPLELGALTARRR